MNHQPNWKPEAPVIPAKLREDGELEEIVRQAIRTKDDVEGRRFERQRLEDMDFRRVAVHRLCVRKVLVFRLGNAPP